MNELQLSNDLNVITAEINSYKQVAGQAIFEIGKRLKHVKENDLVHGEFGKWLENIDMSNQQASRFIKVYEEIPNSSISHVGKISFRALYEIATLPQEEREKEHVTSKGETKTVDEMTVRELARLKKELKEKEDEAKRNYDWWNSAVKQAEQARRSEEIARKKLEEMEDVEPEIIKVVPDDYDYIKGNYESAKGLQDYYKKQNKELRKELEELSQKIKDNKVTGKESDIQKKEKEVKLLQLDASKSVLKTKITIDEFMQEVAVTSYRRGAIASSSEGTKEKLREGLDDLKNFIKEMELALDGTIENTY